MADYIWGDPELTYTGWQGSLQIDEKHTGDTSIYDVAGLDQDEWTIIGLDWGGGEHGWHEMHVIAAPAGEYKAESDARIEAVDFQVTGISPIEFLEKIMHVADFRARISTAVDREIHIFDQRDSGFGM